MWFGILILFIFLTFPAWDKRGEPLPFEDRLIAHRGLHDGNKSVPENSLKAFKKAIEYNFAIELDVLLTEEGIPVVHHDFTAERSMHSTRQIQEMTLEEIKKQGIFGTEERVPTLVEVLELVDGRVPILVEIKGESGGTHVAERTAQVLDHYEGDYAIQSFNPLILHWFKRNRPEIPRGLLATAYFGEHVEQPIFAKIVLSLMFLNVVARPHFINYDCRYAHNLMFRFMKAVYKIPVTGWTFRDPIILKELQNQFAHFVFEGFIPRKV